MKRRIPLILLCFLFMGIGGFSVIRLYQEWNEYRTGEQTYDELTRYVHLDTAPRDDLQLKSTDVESTEPSTLSDESETAAEIDTTVWPVVDFAELWKINPNVVAWIYIEGTKINYPVVQGENNSYYLTHLIDGTSNSAGTLFLDYRNEKELSDRNSIIYGHNMNNGSMFRQITEYKDQTFYEEHPVCLIITPDENYKLEFFSGYVTDMNSEAWKMEFASDDEYAQWLEDAIAKSVFSSNVTPNPQDKVITLSTCTYEYDDARFVLLGVLKS